MFYFLPKKWWSCGCFFVSASEAPKNFWGPQKWSKLILDLKVCLKKLSIGPGLYGKSVLYLTTRLHNVVWKGLVQVGSNFFLVTLSNFSLYNSPQRGRKEIRMDFWHENTIYTKVSILGFTALWFDCMAFPANQVLGTYN